MNMAGKLLFSALVAVPISCGGQELEENSISIELQDGYRSISASFDYQCDKPSTFFPDSFIPSFRSVRIDADNGQSLVVGTPREEYLEACPVYYDSGDPHTMIWISSSASPVQVDFFPPGDPNSTKRGYFDEFAFSVSPASADSDQPKANVTFQTEGTYDVLHSFDEFTSFDFYLQNYSSSGIDVSRYADKNMQGIYYVDICDVAKDFDIIVPKSRSSGWAPLPLSPYNCDLREESGDKAELKLHGPRSAFRYAKNKWGLFETHGTAKSRFNLEANLEGNPEYEDVATLVRGLPINATYHATYGEESVVSLQPGKLVIIPSQDKIIFINGFEHPNY